MLTDSLSLVSFFGRIPPVLRIPEILEMLGRDITLLVGGSVFVLVTGSLATRYKQLQPELQAVQESFRAIGRSNRPAATSEAVEAP